jgi:hypothetical protein
MSKLDLKQMFPTVYCGISTIRCGSCEFEFVYVEPEETERAMSSMGQHVADCHPDDARLVEITVTRY